ncbi:alpha/beta hydrolase [Amycolatopsis sp. NPDC004368]
MRGGTRSACPHADDVVRVLERARITDATLAGHSYGGMVISAAADRAGGRVSRMVHLDAYAPCDGESCWSLTTEEYRQSFVTGATGTGFAVEPPCRAPHGGDPRRRPHPLASLVQRIRLTGVVDGCRGVSRLLLRLGGAHPVRRTSRPAASGSGLARARPPARAQRDAGGPGGRRRAADPALTTVS